MNQKILSRLIQKQKKIIRNAENGGYSHASSLINQIESWATENRRKNGTAGEISADDIRAELGYFSRQATEAAKVEEATFLLKILEAI